MRSNTAITGRIKTGLILSFLLPATISAFGNDPEYFIPKKIEGEIRLDGVLDEAFWNEEAKVPLTQHRPAFGEAPSEATEIMLVYNESFVYLGGRLWDSEPDGVQSPSKQRDEMNLNNDFFGIVFDSFNDKENALAFFTSPSGLRLDFTLFSDAVGDFPANETWNTWWDVAVKKTGEGWFVEMRIPFSSLRFQDENGEVKMGIICIRMIARKNEIISFPEIEYKWGFWSPFKPSQAREAIFSGIVRRNPVYLSLYGLAGVEQLHQLSDDSTAYRWDTDYKLEPGLDLKFNLTSNLTLDLTVNTDFAQVEVDDQQVNLDRFSLFFPEKRLFFQERSSIFDVQTGGYGQLFYSRRIGLNDDGDQIRILGGARLIGRIGEFDLGFIDMQTAAGHGLNSENLGVLRLRRRVINPYSYVGCTFTNRTDFRGNFNTLGGIDGSIRIKTNDFLKVCFAQSFENGLDNRFFRLDQSRFLLNWSNVSQTGFAYDLAYGYNGVDYNPGLGFEQREDFQLIWYDAQYGWLGSPTAKLLRHRVSSQNYIYLNLLHGKWETSENRFQWEFEYKSGWYWHSNITYQKERVFDAFEIGDIEISKGDYRFLEGEVVVVTPSSGLVYNEMYVSAGRFFGGSRLTCGVAPSWNLFSSLYLSAFYEFNLLDFPGQGRETVQVGRLRALFMFNTKLSIAGFVQYNSAAHVWAGNFRLRFNPREGNDLYIVLNQNVNSDRSRETPVLPPVKGYNILVKYTHTFRL